MRHKISLPRRATAFALAFLLLLPTAYAAAGEKKLQTSTQIMDGLTYRNTVTNSGGSRVESFSFVLEPDSPVRPILWQGSETIYTGAAISWAVSTAQAAGYHVVGAVNTDFFNMSNGVPIGIVIEDGVYKSSNANENAMAVVNGRVSILDRPSVSLSLHNQTSGATVVPNYFNKARGDAGGVYLLNRDFSTLSTHTSTSGWYVRMKALPAEGSDRAPGLTVNSVLTLEVTELLASSEATVIGPDEYILTAADASGYGDVFASFHVGEQVILTTSCSDPVLSAAQWAGGVGDIMVRDGAVTDSSNWVYAKDGRQPRTALGIKADGTLVVYAVDGRKAGHSVGLTQANLADELLSQGCVTAVNLDGGGSTSLSVWMPGESGPAIRNIPSDGSPRRCATFLMLVTEQRGDGQASRLAMAEDGPVVLTGSSAVLPQVYALDEGLNLVSADLSGLTYTSLNELGTVRDGVYTAGNQAGTDILRLDTRNLSGTAQIHVVDALTELKVTRAGSTSALSALSPEPGEQIQLAVSGSYWGREALRDFGPVVCTVQGSVGAVDQNGLFTASETPGSGSITLSAGGQSKTIQISMTNVHEDVPPDHWAYDAVEYCYGKGIVSGISPTLFGRDLSITRADFMVMLYAAMGKPAPVSSCTFTDVKADSYYYNALAWAQPLGLAAGVGDGQFNPAAQITREQAFTLFRAFLPIAGKACPDGALSVLDRFADQDQIAEYARIAAATLVSQGLVTGSDTGLAPRNTLSRAEMAVMLRQVLEFTPTTSADPVTPVNPVDPVNPVNPSDPGSSAGHVLALKQSQITLASGSSSTLDAILLPAVEGASITWSSSNPNAAAVSPTGMVTNLHAGFTDETAVVTASWNGLSAKCTVVCQAAQRVGTVTGTETGLNVRSGPGTTYAAVGGLRDGAQVIVLSQQEGWYQILFRNPEGQAAIGYVSADYLVVKG